MGKKEGFFAFEDLVRLAGMMVTRAGRTNKEAAHIGPFGAFGLYFGL